MSELIKRAHEYAESVFVSHLDLEKEDPDGEVSIKNMRSMAYYEGSLQTLDAFVAELEKEAEQFVWGEGTNSIITVLGVDILKIKQTAKRMKGDV